MVRTLVPELVEYLITYGLSTRIPWAEDVRSSRSSSVRLSLKDVSAMFAIVVVRSSNPQSIEGNSEVCTTRKIVLSPSTHEMSCAIECNYMRTLTHLDPLAFS